MPRFLFSLLTLCILSAVASAQDKPAYQIFDSSGQVVPYQAMLDSLATGDVVFFGEIHNDPIAHWLQLELARDLHARRDSALILGAEMFEADNQLLLDEYLQGLISTRNFEQEARLWNNYPTDYKPLVDFAIDRNLPFIATNIPRRYANLVFREGLTALDSLSASAKAFLPPLPIPYDPDLPGYKAMLEMMPGHSGGENATLPMAQAVKDATMAHFIGQNLRPGALFLHVNGAYHSDNFEGILWYLQRAHPDLKVWTLTNVAQDELGTLEAENQGKANFILAVPSAMTKTF